MAKRGIQATHTLILIHDRCECYYTFHIAKIESISLIWKQPLVKQKSLCQQSVKIAQLNSLLLKQNNTAHDYDGGDDDDNEFNWIKQKQMIQFAFRFSLHVLRVHRNV